MRFQDKVVFITGAGRGLGRAIALAFGREGARLGINDLTPVNLDETERQLQDMKVEVLAMTGDIAKKMQVQSLIEAVLDRFGRLDILINNAAVEPVSAMMLMDEWDWDRTLAVNLKGPFLTMQSAARVMTEQAGGSIVNLGAHRLRGAYLAERSAYAASKEGLLALTRAAALEFAPNNIRVNAVCPGEVRHEPMNGSTDAHRATGGPSRWVTPEAVAEAVLYLCSEDAKFVTGEVLTVDAGAGAG
ncbi:MAG: SDR family oxidoreductase [Anaerolineales bacterium]|nr:MAG: SDR family oxidoreductase [Anaerolineales bacterium]